MTRPDEESPAEREARRQREREARRAYRERNVDRIREQARAYRERNADRIRERSRAYRERNADQMRSLKREWRVRNADHIREYRAAYDAEHRDEVLAQKREYMKGYSAQKAVERRRRDAKRAASKKYYEANKDKHHQYEREWRARKLAEDPDGYRARRAAYQRHRRERTKDADNEKLRAHRHANPEANRAAQRAYYARNADKLKAQKREHYQAHREEILARNRAWKEREKRRQQAGLPPRRIRSIRTMERDANQSAADAFFTRPRTRAEIPALRRPPGTTPVGLEPPSPEEVAAFARDSHRARIAHFVATDGSLADRSRIAEARRHLASQQRAAERAERETAENARLDAIGKEVNDRLRPKQPTPRRHHLDPAAPHPMLGPNHTMGLNR